MKKSIIIPILFVIIFCVACNPHGNDIAEYRKNAKAQITSYVQQSDFHKEEHDFIYEIMDECIAQIELSDSKEEIDALVSSGKEEIIEAYKDYLSFGLTTYQNYKIESNFYSEENLLQLTNIVDRFNETNYSDKASVDAEYERCFHELDEVKTLKVSGEFYSLENAYNNGKLTKDDLIAISQAEFTEDDLPQIIQTEIRTEFLQQIDEKDYTVGDLGIHRFFGEYHGCYVVQISDRHYDYPAVDLECVIDDIVIIYSGPSIVVWEMKTEESRERDYVLQISAEKQVYAVDEEIVIDITLENRSGADIEIAYYLLFYPESSTGLFPNYELAPITTKKLFKNGEIIHSEQRLGGCFPIGQHELKFTATFYLSYEMTEYGYETTDDEVEVRSNAISFSVI